MRIGRILGIAMLWLALATAMVGTPRPAFALSTDCAFFPTYDGFYAPFNLYDQALEAGEVISFQHKVTPFGVATSISIVVEGVTVATGLPTETIYYTIPTTRTYSEIIFDVTVSSGTPSSTAV
ncbi:MAG TPA: hypothetical protein PK691_09010, partial [Thermomicrobiales bacterium]|nr:hypothetical protein [Thermomicrobiales bacterium]